MNRVGKYSVSGEVDELLLMNMVFELSEKERMIMWSEGYIDLIIEKLPVFARDILENRKEKWEDTKAYIIDTLNQISGQRDFLERMNGERKQFAIFVIEHYRVYQSLLFLMYDGNLKDEDVRKFVYRHRFGAGKYSLK
ncbi:MAG: hypothetical protein K0S25_2024 [Bacillus sp. (in: firmicutes)]|nr:hypothetical protein [Bacillus sp. (in: firmicutes)]